MGKAGRVACIFTPMVLTIISFVCILLINLGGINEGSSTLNNLYFFEADFSNFSVSSGNSTLGTVIELAKEEGLIADFYQIHLWNYCNGTDNSTTSGSTTQDVTWCSPRKTGFWFDPMTVWDFAAAVNSTADSLASDSDVDSSLLSSLESYVSDDTEELEDEILDASTRKAIKIYQKVSKWMFAAYFAGMWTLLATIGFGILAIFSRWGSFLTWIMAFISLILIFGGSLTATVMFKILVTTLHEKLKDYGVTVSQSTHTLAVTWLATAFILIATLFWLFSACCCSGSSNPHHFRNKAPPSSDLGFGGAGGLQRGRSLKVEKTGAAYERVESPYAGGAGHGDNVPLTHVGGAPYGQETGYAHEPQSPVWSSNAAPYGGYDHGHSGNAFEPYRHN